MSRRPYGHYPMYVCERDGDEPARCLRGFDDTSRIAWSDRRRARPPCGRTCRSARNGRTPLDTLADRRVARRASWLLGFGRKSRRSESRGWRELAQDPRSTAGSVRLPIHRVREPHTRGVRVPESPTGSVASGPPRRGLSAPQGPCPCATSHLGPPRWRRQAREPELVDRERSSPPANVDEEPAPRRTARLPSRGRGR